MRRFAFGISACLVAFAMAACLPTIVSLYRPTAPGGSVLAYYCQGDRESISFDRRGVVASVELSQSGVTPLFASLSFQVPARNLVLLLDSAVEVSVDTARRATRIVLVPSRATWPWSPEYGRGGQRVDAPMVGAGSKPGTYARFAFAAEILPTPRDSFTVTLPRFSVNGDAIELPPIEFAKGRKFTVLPFNC